jgi:hypothetical protein
MRSIISAKVGQRSDLHRDKIIDLMMDAVTAAHYRVQAVVIGDMRFTKAEHGAHDPVRRTPLPGAGTCDRPMSQPVDELLALNNWQAKPMPASSSYKWRWVCHLRQLETQRDLLPTGRWFLGWF